MLPSPIRLLLAFALFLGCCLAQTDEQKLDAVRTFRSEFPKFRGVPQQVEAVMTLKYADCPESAHELLKLFEHKTPEVRKAAITVFGEYKDEASFKPLLEDLATLKATPRRSQIIEALGRAKHKPALAAFREILAKDKKADVGVRYAIARAIDEIGDPAVKSELALLLADPESLVRMAAADSVGKLKVKDLGPALLPLFADPTWQVQVAAVQAAAKVRAPEAVDGLIELMRKGGRFREECGEALFKITALDFGIDAEEWDRQWKKLKEIGWRIPTDEELKKKEESRRKTDALYGKLKTDKTEFVGVKTTSTNVLFIIDVSGSMEELVVEHEKFQSGYDDYRKFTIVQTELLRTLGGLKENTFFNIVAFATELDAWKPILVPANIVNRENAMSWVRRLKPLGGVESQELAAAGLGGSVGAGKTNTYKALTFIFGFDPDKQAEAPPPTTGGAASFKKSRLDTVFFLSDGRPSTGKFTDMGEIQREIKRMNEPYKVVIHTIAIGEFQKEFMKGLAADSGGVFVDLGK